MIKLNTMKKLLLLILLLTIPLVLAEETLKQGDSTTIGGKTFTLVAVGETGNAVGSVDGISKIVELNEEEEINGVNVLLTSAVYMGEDSIAKFILESIEEAQAAATPHVVVCGDNVCEGSEDKDNCCKDCGCKYGYGCENNKCVKAECMEDKDCYSAQKDYCVLDKCDAISKKCTHKPIINCVVNDKCCPTNCYYPNDSDCPTIKLDPNPTQTPLESQTDETNTEINETKTNPQELKKPSFFAKIIIWIVNLFR